MVVERVGIIAYPFFIPQFLLAFSGAFGVGSIIAAFLCILGLPWGCVQPLLLSQRNARAWRASCYLRRRSNRLVRFLTMDGIRNMSRNHRNDAQPLIM